MVHESRNPVFFLRFFLDPKKKEFLKPTKYPRHVKPVIIKSGAWNNPGCIITAGITIGENSIVSVGSVVTSDVPDYCIVAGNPARIIKKIEH